MINRKPCGSYHRPMARQAHGCVGVLFIEWATRRLQLTFDGETYFQACSKALDDKALRGRVHIDMPIAIGKSVLLAVLLGIASPHPEMALTMGFNEATVELMRDQAHLVVRFGQVEGNSQLVARKLSSQARVVCGAPGYLAAQGIPTKLADLNGHRCIIGTAHGPPASSRSRRRPPCHATGDPPIERRRVHR